MDRQAEGLIQDVSYLFLLVGLLLVVGFVFIYSASAIYAHEYLGNPHYFFAKQFLGVLGAAGGFFLFYTIPPHFWQKHLGLFLGFSWVLAALLVLPQFKVTLHGVSRLLLFSNWSIQPNELVKLFTPMYLGYFLARKDPQIWRLRDYLSLATLYLFLLLILLRQPDFATASIILLSSLAVCFVARCRILFLAGVGLSVGVALWYHVAMTGSLYEVVRTMVLPWTGLVSDDAHVMQSMVAVSSGGWWGTIATYAKQKFFYIPGSQADYIFSLIAEEVGFFGSLCLFGMYLLFALFGLRVVRRLEDPFSSYTTLGFVVMIALQACLHVIAALGMAPVWGVGLPFISFGSSSLVVMGCMLGFVAHAVRAQEQRHAPAIAF